MEDGKSGSQKGKEKSGILQSIVCGKGIPTVGGTAEAEV